MDDEGHYNVTIAPSEDVQRNQMELVSLPSPEVRNLKLVTFELGAHDLRVAYHISSTRLDIEIYFIYILYIVYLYSMHPGKYVKYNGSYKLSWTAVANE